MTHAKYRGRRTDTNEYVYGNYLVLIEGMRNNHCIIETNCDYDGLLGERQTKWYVHADSVGRSMGLAAAGGMDVYEGDVLEHSSSTKTMIFPPYTEVVDPSWEIYAIDEISIEQTVTLIEQHNTYFGEIPTTIPINKYTVAESRVVGDIFENDEYRKLMK